MKLWYKDLIKYYMENIKPMMLLKLYQEYIWISTSASNQKLTCKKTLTILNSAEHKEYKEQKCYHIRPNKLSEVKAKDHYAMSFINMKY